MSEKMFSRRLGMLILALLIGLTVPVLIRDGMFMDAVLYTSVSHNLANGIGTFWFPQFSLNNVASLPAFHEQPPLAFGIQAVFFKLLGSSMLVERLYCFIVMLLTARLIVAIRKILLNSQEHDGLNYSPLLFWIIIPVVFWSYSNNMHENTMTVFVLLSVYAFLKALQPSESFVLPTILASACVAAATLTKGFPGLYTMAVPLLYGITMHRAIGPRVWMVSICACLILAGLFSLLFTIDPAASSLKTYLFDRALYRMNQVPTVNYRFYILRSLLEECLPALLLTLIFLWIQRTKSRFQKTDLHGLRCAVFCLVLAFAGSAPLMLTKVQKGFYLIPAMPFFALSASFFALPGLRMTRNLIQKNETASRLFATTSGVLFLVAILLSIFFYGKPGRDQALLADVDKIIQVVPQGEVVGLDPDCWNDWSLQCYLMRKAFVSLDTQMRYRYHLVRNTNQINEVNSTYIPVSLKLSGYILYKTEKPIDRINWKQRMMVKHMQIKPSR